MIRALILTAALAFLMTPPQLAHGAEGAAPLVSGMQDQTGLELTIYNSDLALVKDRRAVGLKKGLRELRFMDVAARIVPQSLQVRAEGFEVLEQNYEYDLLSPQRMMEKYVGREVRVNYKNPYTGEEEITPATILSVNGGTVMKVGDEITFNYPGRISFPSVPEDLISRPTLVWLLNSRDEGRSEVEATYLTHGIGWRADYVLSVGRSDDMADLNGWVTITNQSGSAYRDASLKLVAGDVNRVVEAYDMVMLKGEAVTLAESDQFKEHAFFEYHLYDLDRPTTIKDNQTKQISLLKADGVAVQKEYIFRGAQYYYSARLAEPLRDAKVGVFLNFKNAADNNLGMPLPEGTVRVYKRDAEGSLQFIGEDAIDHTPKDETVAIKLGDAFDIVAERVQTSWSRIASNVYETEFRITLRNHKEEDVTVRVLEPMPGDWKILSASHDYTKPDASTAEFALAVPKDGETVLTYKARIKY